MKRRIAFLLFFLCLFSGCQEEIQKKPPEYVSTEECFLCGRAWEGPWEQNNIGLISLNSFDRMEVEINLYDGEGRLVEKSVGGFRMQTFHSGERGFWAGVTADPDRGYAMVTVGLGEDLTADREKVAAFLCEECLERILPEDGEGQTGLGVIDLASGEVRVLNRQISGFTLGDFYVHSDWEEKGEKVELSIFFCPLRYGKEE